MDDKRLFNKEDITELKELNKKIEKSKYRQHYHVQTLTGLLNDPNGFSFHNGRWNLFYQWYPYDAKHGLKHWYHTKSDDLINFENIGLALLPKEEFENHGAYSGSAYSKEDKLHLFYTGNYRDDEYIRNPKQIHAMLKDNKVVDKKVLIETNELYTEHQRDPSIYFNEKDNSYYIFLGVQTKQKNGGLALYKSKNLDKDFEYIGQVNIDGYKDFGYMWECPGFFRIDDKDVLVISPQGLDKNGYKLNNKHNAGYITGKMDFENLEFKPENEFIEFDRGFEFYAPQIANNSNDKYMIAWMGLPDLELPIDSEKWSGCMTIVRKLKLKNNKLYQYPLDFSKYFSDEIFNGISNSFESKARTGKLKISNDKYEFEIKIYSNFIITYKDGLLTIDRSKMSIKIDDEFGETRSIECEVKSLDIFIDNSSIEVFVNDGQYTMTTRIFPDENENLINVSSENKVSIVYKAIRKVESEFVI